MVENIITVTFEVESEAYKAINDLKRDFANDDYVISHVSLVKNENGHIAPYDNFDSGVETADDAYKGGLVGALVGILGGPIGVILGGSWGTLIGGTIDATEAAVNASLLEQVSLAIPEGKTALLILAQESSEDAVSKKLDDYTVEIIKQNAAEVAAEVEEAARLQREMEKETRQKLREEKKESAKQKISEKQNELKSKFNAFKEKLSK